MAPVSTGALEGGDGQRQARTSVAKGQWEGESSARWQRGQHRRAQEEGRGQGELSLWGGRGAPTASPSCGPPCVLHPCARGPRCAHACGHVFVFARVCESVRV